MPWGMACRVAGRACGKSSDRMGRTYEPVLSPDTQLGEAVTMYAPHALAGTQRANASVRPWNGMLRPLAKVRNGLDDEVGDLLAELRVDEARELRPLRGVALHARLAGELRARQRVEQAEHAGAGA